MVELLDSLPVTDRREDVFGDTGAAELCGEAQRAAEVGSCSVCNDCVVCTDGQAGGRLQKNRPERRRCGP